MKNNGIKAMTLNLKKSCFNMGKISMSFVLILSLIISMGSCQKSDENDLGSISVVETTPMNDSTDVDVFSDITVTFSDEIEVASVNENSFIVKKGQFPIYGKVSYSGKTAVFKPSQQLADNKEYSCTITIEVKGAAGQSMANDYHWSFTSGKEPDLIAPTISSHIPLDSEDWVFTDGEIQVVFSEEMDAESINISSFMVKNGDNVVDGSVTYTENTAIFIPDNALMTNTVYNCIVTNQVKDLAGNHLAENLEWNFTTIPEIIGFNAIILPVIKTGDCAGCHNENRDPNLKESLAYNSLINGQYVDTNNPEGSKIVEMLNGDFHKDFISAKEKRLILEWIKQGAENN